MGLCWKEVHQLVVCDLWRKVRLEVPLGLCENLINALKLLANLPQSIVTNLGTGSRKSLTDGLRDFIKVDNYRALEVGELHQGTGTFKVRKPKVPEGGSDFTIREGPDELTLRAEEVNTLKAYIDVNHIEQERSGCSTS